MSRVLVVGGEHAFAEKVALELIRAGFEVRVAHEARRAIAEVDRALPDLLVLGELPQDSGVLELVRIWRAEARTQEMALVVLSPREHPDERLVTLSAGADDCLFGPSASAELVPRVRALLRRRAEQRLNSVVRVDPLQLNLSTRRVSCGGVEVRLTPTEFRLLHFFMVQPECVHSRRQLRDQIWGGDMCIDERTVDVHVKRLREALDLVKCSQMIETVRGAGYRLCLRQSAEA